MQYRANEGSFGLAYTCFGYVFSPSWPLSDCGYNATSKMNESGLPEHARLSKEITDLTQSNTDLNYDVRS